MLKKLVNEAFFTLRITTTGPLLVKSGHASISGPDMTPVLTWRDGRQEVFLPGSSLKGVFRSHIEKIVCGLKSRVVCYPFEGNDDRQAGLDQRQRDYLDSCGGWFNKFAKDSDNNRRTLEERTDLVYAASCPTCRLFGSTGFIGRVAIGDAYLASDEIKEQRDGVGIDRLTGGASHGARFELEVVSTGVTFETDIHLRNFEIWQLGMLLVILQDMEDELIHIGSGRSRGLGKVSAIIAEEGKHGRSGGLVISTLRKSQHERQEGPLDVWGLGCWLNDGSYGTRPDDRLHLAESVERAHLGIRSTRSFAGKALADLRAKALEQFVERMQTWEDMRATLTEVGAH
jgi:CRISPR-associated RAMP protein (TIGR02581 family)